MGNYHIRFQWGGGTTNPKMKNLKFFTCKRHDAFTWKNPWIDIKLHDLKF
jgi:hypothetical protein